MLRIIHSSDVHLGKSSAFLDDETASLMREARFAIRRDLERCLVVAPGNLVEQWMLRLGQPLTLAGAPHGASL